MKGFIISSKAISTQDTFEGGFPIQQLIPPSLKMLAKGPDYKKYLPAPKIRRMAHITRMGLTAALEALKAANIDNPGAIVTATGWGCLADTYKFLIEMREKGEQTLSPATFIQSTHNTVAGQIALMLQCQEYNSTNVHHTASFEHSLIDALMLLAEGKQNVLVGGVDEIMDADYELKRKYGYWKNPEDSLDLPSSNTRGTLAGEGGIYFVLADKPVSGNEPVIKGATVSSQPEPMTWINAWLNKQGVKPEEIDILISGLDGDIDNNKVYARLRETVFPDATSVYYKHVFGDFDTASAIALWLADKIMQNQTIPPLFLMPGRQPFINPIKHILIHHYTKPEEHAFILVSKAGV